ncbi:glycerol dehydrogenase [Thermoclostridium stercorarium subsp. leptospartum DSM 9219]|nr:glycerol dehydrogenase [Thermoclostridium stercorarium subsp. stercorarium DSM 8532]ANX02673.1 glycerol dehydrogenase [Thermoclostridium stercorarium subsp. leptospartum DSM 9219]
MLYNCTWVIHMILARENISKYKIQDYLGRGFLCNCGREHSVDIEKVVIENGAIAKIPEILIFFNFKKIFMVADENTYNVAGAGIEKILRNGDFELYKLVYIREGNLVPDEKAMGEFIINLPETTDVILAVGSGVISDLCKFMSYKLKIPYIMVATAPSMDGYASTAAPLTINGLKTTLSATVPKAIIGDIDILKNAPMDMIRAGFGDVIGKYSAINDWKLGRLINDEYYCEFVSDMVMYSVKKCVETADRLQKRDDSAIRNLMECLLLTGIAMSYTGNSRPASGSEHHLSHFIEMVYMFDGKESPPHGIKVGFNTIAVNYIREKISELNPDFSEVTKKASEFDKNKWLEDVKRLFRVSAAEVIDLNEREGINSYDKRMKRVKRIIDRWNEIVEILAEVPSYNEIRDILRKIGAPVTLKELGVDRETVLNGLVYAKEIRNRYTVLQLAWDLGVLGDLAEEMGQKFYV